MSDSQEQHHGPRFIWAIGFLALGTLSGIGAAALFPWYLAIAIAVLVVGLASACAFQFRATHNPLYLVAMCLMTALAAFLDGVSVWEMLNKHHNQGLHASRAVEGAMEGQLAAAEKQVESARMQIADLVRQATDMDNDGIKENDRLIPGQLALIESRKADLANLQSRVDDLRMEVVGASTTAMVTDKGRHVLLQMADEHEHPERWLITRASAVFLIPEFTLALLAWSLYGGRRREEHGMSPSPSGAEAAFAAQVASHHAQWLVHQQQMHAMHAMSHPGAFGGQVPAPVHPVPTLAPALAPALAAHAVPSASPSISAVTRTEQIVHSSGYAPVEALEQSGGGNGPMINPIAARVAEVERERLSEAVPAPVMIEPSSPWATAGTTDSPEESLDDEEVALAPQGVEELSALASPSGHPGHLHHSPPVRVNGAGFGAPGSHPGRGDRRVISAKEAKRRRREATMRPTEVAKREAEGRKSRNLTEVAANLDRNTKHN